VSARYVAPHVEKYSTPHRRIVALVDVKRVETDGGRTGAGYFRFCELRNGSPFLIPSTAQDVLQGDVAFVARILEHLLG